MSNKGAMRLNLYNYSILCIKIKQHSESSLTIKYNIVYILIIINIYVIIYDRKYNIE